jgi:hypothetical protein
MISNELRQTIIMKRKIHAEYLRGEALSKTVIVKYKEDMEGEY